uniref:Uncharacterized protein n=1 Tax=viral metagenome TaxID=1070528 RepID=A0A6M3LMM4_9ZZZZ
MGHYDLNTVIMRLGGIFSEGFKGIKQEKINKNLKEAFNYDFLNEFEKDENYEETMESRLQKEESYNEIFPDLETARELFAFLNGNFVGDGTKGSCFSYSSVGNYRELQRMEGGWKLITSKIKDNIPPIFLLNMCEDEEVIDYSIVHNGEVLDDKNLLFERLK